MIYKVYEKKQTKKEKRAISASEIIDIFETNSASLDLDIQMDLFLLLRDSR